MYADPLWLAVIFLLAHVRLRARAARRNATAGALSLEWIVLIGIIVVAAITAGVFFVAKIKDWESKIP